MTFFEAYSFLLRKIARQATRIHLDKGSISLTQHQVNLRIEAINLIGRARKGDFNYSGCFTMAEGVVTKVRQILLSTIEESERIFIDTADDQLVLLKFDFVKYL